MTHYLTYSGTVLFNWTMDLKGADSLWIEPLSEDDRDFLMLDDYYVSNNMDIVIRLNKSIDLELINNKPIKVSTQ